MKYFFSLLLSVAMITAATAQDFKKVETNVLLKKFEEAKTELDKALANPKNQDKAEGFYWKSRIYAALLKDTVNRTKYPNLMNDANDAFQKYFDLDTSLSLVQKKGADAYFDMYSTTFNLGQSAYNKENFQEASIQFKNAVVYSDYIFKNNWASLRQPFDTLTIQYCASSYFRSGNEVEGIKYYTRLADSKLSNPIYSDIYRTVLQYYSKNKNKIEFDKYLKLSTELFPSANWEDFEMDYIDKNYDLQGKLSLFDEMQAQGLLTENKYLQFGEAFISAKSNEELDTATIEKYTQKAIYAYKKAFELNNTNTIASFNIGLTYYLIYQQEDDNYRANLKKLQELNAGKQIEKDPKKKVAADLAFKSKTDIIKKDNSLIEQKIFQNIDNSIEWLTKTHLLLRDKSPRSNIEKSIINNSVDKIANLFEYKMNKVRGKDEKLFNLYEAKYKEFDDLHSKY